MARSSRADRRSPQRFDRLAYYREHAPLLARQLAGRDCRAVPGPVSPVRIDGPGDVLRQVEAGAEGFLVGPASGRGQRTVDRWIVTLQPGDGTDIATAASAALAIGDELAGHGLAVVTLLDGRGGLVLYGMLEPTDAAELRNRLSGFLADYAEQAPELATMDPAQADGRVLLSAAGTDPDVLDWAPYSLVPGACPGVVVPVHRDDIAAASAGMPLDIEPADVANRIRLRGDLLSVEQVVASPVRTRESRPLPS
jgi:DNA primase